MPPSRRGSSAPIAKTEAAIRTHRAVNGIFSQHAAQKRKVTQDRESGSTWTNTHSGPISGGIQSLYTPAQLHKLQQEGLYVDTEGNIAHGAPQDDFAQENRSCYLMNAQKQFHRYGRDDPEAAKRALQNERYSYTDAWREYNKAQAIIRHEKTIPKRRIVDKYVQLIPAQADLHQDVPNASAIRGRVRRHEGWVLNNEHRQEAERGKPLMTRILQGEYYYADGALNAKAGDFVRLNKQHVRSASAVSRVANARAPVSALPPYATAPEPRKVISTLKTYDADSEAGARSTIGRAASACGRTSTNSRFVGGAGTNTSMATRGGINQSQRLPIGHRHYHPHRTENITAGGRAAQQIIRPTSCHHERSTPLFDGMLSQTYEPGVWPPVPTQPNPHHSHYSHRF